MKIFYQTLGNERLVLFFVKNKFSLFLIINSLPLLIYMREKYFIKNEFIALKRGQNYLCSLKIMLQKFTFFNEITLMVWGKGMGGGRSNL